MFHTVPLSQPPLSPPPTSTPTTPQFKEPHSWTIQEVADWVERICKLHSLPHHLSTLYKNNFLNAKINGLSLLSMNFTQLQYLCSDDETTEKIYNEIKSIQRLQSEKPEGVSCVLQNEYETCAKNAQIWCNDCLIQLCIQCDVFIHAHGDGVMKGAEREHDRVLLQPPPPVLPPASAMPPPSTTSLTANHQIEFTLLPVPLTANFECKWEGCGARFNLSLELVGHVVGHVYASFQAGKSLDLSKLCLYCGESFSSQSDLRQHLKTVHQNGQNVMVTYFPSPSNIPLNPPSSATLNLPSTVALNSPLNSRKRKAQDQLNAPLNSKKRKAEDRPFVCDVEGCGKRFKRSGHLKRHKLTHRPKEQRKRFHCSEPGCGKSYSTKYDLTAHIKSTHQGRKLFKCPTKGCCRRFVKPESLDKHKNVSHDGSIQEKEGLESENTAQNPEAPVFNLPLPSLDPSLPSGQDGVMSFEYK